MRRDIDTYEKQPSESRLYEFDFSGKMTAAETISSVTSVTPSPASGITVGAPTTSGQVVQVRISSGTADTTYKLTVIVVTSAGNTLEMEGRLHIRNN